MSFTPPFDIQAILKDPSIAMSRGGKSIAFIAHDPDSTRESIIVRYEGYHCHCLLYSDGKNINYGNEGEFDLVMRPIITERFIVIKIGDKYHVIDTFIKNSESFWAIRTDADARRQFLNKKS